MGNISCNMKISETIFQGAVNFNDRVFTEHQLEFKKNKFYITNHKGGTVCATIDNTLYTGFIIAVEDISVLVDDKPVGVLSKPIWDDAPALPSLHLNTKRVVGLTYQDLMKDKLPEGNIVGAATPNDIKFQAGQSYNVGSVVVTGIDFSTWNNSSVAKQNSSGTTSNNHNKISTSTAINVSAVGIGAGTYIENGAKVSIGTVQAGLVSYSGSTPQRFFEQNNDSIWEKVKSTDCFELIKKRNNTFKVTVSYPQIPQHKKDAVGKLMEDYADNCTKDQITWTLNKQVKALIFNEETATKLYDLLTEIVLPKVTSLKLQSKL